MTEDLFGDIIDFSIDATAGIFSTVNKTISQQDIMMWFSAIGFDSTGKGSKSRECHEDHHHHD